MHAGGNEIFAAVNSSIAKSMKVTKSWLVRGTPLQVTSFNIYTSFLVSERVIHPKGMAQLEKGMMWNSATGNSLLNVLQTSFQGYGKYCSVFEYLKKKLIESLSLFF